MSVPWLVVTWIAHEDLEGWTMKLKRNDICPIHHSRCCCGRDFKAIGKMLKWVRIAPGVTRNVQTGLVRRSPSAMRKLLSDKVIEQKNLCAWCREEFTDAREIVADHIRPRGMCGARRDDSPANIQAAHAHCNLEKGSRRT